MSFHTELNFKSLVQGTESILRFHKITLETNKLFFLKKMRIKSKESPSCGAEHRILIFHVRLQLADKVFDKSLLQGAKITFFFLTRQT